MLAAVLALTTDAAAAAADPGVPVKIWSFQRSVSGGPTDSAATTGAIPPNSLIVVVTGSNGFRKINSLTLDGSDPGFIFANIGFGNAANNSIAYHYTAGGYASGVTLAPTFDGNSVRDSYAYYISGISPSSPLGTGIVGSGDGAWGSAGPPNYSGAKHQATTAAPAATLAWPGGVGAIAISVLNIQAGQADTVVQDADWTSLDNTPNSSMRTFVAYKLKGATSNANKADTNSSSSRVTALSVATFKAA